MKKTYWYALLGVAVVVLLAAFTFMIWSSETRQAGSLKYDLDESLSAGDSAQDAEPSFGFSGRAAAPSAEKGIGGNLAINDTSGADNAEQKPQNRLIIKTGSLAMVVNNVNEALGKIAAFATNNKGFVVYSNVDEHEFTPFGTITIRIPSEIFDKGVSELKQLGEVKSESVNGQDVTEEFVDLESQLKNLRAAESQFLEIMKKAVKIEDVLAVQRELTQIRAQIEQIQGRMKYLTESARLSTLTVTLSTDPSKLPVIEDDDKWNPIGTFKDALRSLIDALKDLGDIIIWLVVYIPVLLIWVVIGWGVYKVVNMIRRRYTK